MTLLLRGYPVTWAWRFRGWVLGCRLRMLALVVIRCAAPFLIQVACSRLWTDLACSLWLIYLRRLISAGPGWDSLTSASYLAGQGDLWKMCLTGGPVGRMGFVLASIVVRRGSVLDRPALPSCDELSIQSSVEAEWVHHAHFFFPRPKNDTILNCDSSVVAEDMRHLEMGGESCQDEIADATCSELCLC